MTVWVALVVSLARAAPPIFAPATLEADVAALRLWRVAGSADPVVWFDAGAAQVVDQVEHSAPNFGPALETVGPATFAEEVLVASVRESLNDATRRECLQDGSAVLRRAAPQIAEDWLLVWPARVAIVETASVPLRCVDGEVRWLALASSAERGWRLVGCFSARRADAWDEVAMAVAVDLPTWRAHHAEDTAAREDGFPTGPVPRWGGLLDPVVVTRRVPMKVSLEGLPRSTTGIACTVRVSIDTQGVPASIRFRRCPRVLQERAEEAARAWRWQPPMFEGVPVPAVYDIRFIVREQPED